MSRHAPLQYIIVHETRCCLKYAMTPLVWVQANQEGKPRRNMIQEQGLKCWNATTIPFYAPDSVKWND